MSKDRQKIRLIGQLLLMVAVILITACTSIHAMSSSITFDCPRSVNLVLEDTTVAERVEAVRELLLSLDNEDEITSTAVFEDSRVVVVSKTGADEFEWSVPFHLVWPQPRLNNQHLNAIKLVNWTVTGKAVEPTARFARQQAIDRLRSTIGERVDAGGSLVGRIRIVGRESSAK